MPARTQLTADRFVLEELDAEITTREAELTALRLARDVLRSDESSREGRCDGAAAGACHGTVWKRFCRACGAVIARCEGAHGGIEAATSAMHAHQEEHRGRAA